MTSRPLALVLAVALAATACGSTVQLDDGGPVGEAVTLHDGEAELDLGAAASTPDDPGNAAGAGDEQRAAGSAPLPSDRSGADPAPATGPAPGPATPQEQAPLPEGEPLTVGLAVIEEVGATNEAVGAPGLTAGDMQRNYEVLLAHVNGRGGAAGHQIVPVYHRYQTSSAQSFSAQEQSACANYTQDNDVFAMLDRGSDLTTGTLLACLHNAGVPVLASPGSSLFADTTFQRYPTFAESNTLSLDAIARLWPPALATDGYFDARGATSPTRVGLITYDSPAMRQVTERSLEPALRASGHEFAERVFVSQPDRLADVGGVAAEVNNAILRFQTFGVTHVMIQDLGNALLTLLFMTSAESQRYRPRYGLTSNNGGQALVGAVPAEQYTEARLVSWNPVLDVPEREFDGPLGQARETCDRVFADAGITFEDVVARFVGYTQCDALLSFVAVIEALPGQPDRAGLVPAFTGLGTSWQSALLGPTRVAPDRRFGVARHRLARFSRDCTCFRYTSDWRHVP